MQDKSGERRGLGKVVYDTDPGPTAETERQDDVVVEASKESFPASDPPNYSGGSTTEESAAEEIPNERA